MKRTRGFTLLEVLLALGLIAMLAGGVMGFLLTLLNRRDGMNQRLVDAQSGAALLDRIESDILCGLAGDGGSGAGISGTTTSLHVLTRGVALPVEPGMSGASKAGDRQGSEYVFDAASGVLRARRWMSGEGTAAGEFEVVSGHLEAVRLSYFDGETWRGSFDSAAADGLPVAVEVAIWFGVPRPPEDGPVASPESGDTTEAADASVAAKPSAPPRREPDRIRVIVVPDGPVTSWKESR
jgi:prepilin-type N-terminal cleavage/methylation domain-containing protein